MAPILVDYVYAGHRLVARTGEEPASRRHLHLDHLGTPVRVTDAAGVLAESHAYAPYGERVGGGTANDPVQFTGHERDAETGTDAMPARQYDPGLGRFLSIDPVLGALTAPQSFAAYSYVLGNPMTLIDPTGREDELPGRSGGPHEEPCAFGRPCNPIADIDGGSIDVIAKEPREHLWEWYPYSARFFFRNMSIEGHGIFGPPEGFPVLFYAPDPTLVAEPPPGDDGDEEEVEEPALEPPGPCIQRNLSFSGVVATQRRADAEAAFHSSAHGRLVRDLELATLFAPSPLPPEISVLLSAANQVNGVLALQNQNSTSQGPFITATKFCQ